MKSDNPIKTKLQSVSVTPNKRKGQNFLSDTLIADAIINFANVSSADFVLEIGPGLGILTERLIKKVKKLLVIETEKNFCEALTAKGVEVIHTDVRNLSIKEFSKLVVVSNLPYSISTDVVLWLIEMRESILRSCLLLQREFAERLAAPPGSKNYGRLSVLRTLYADAKLGFIVPGTAFYPVTKVESRLIELTFLPKPRVELVDEKVFSEVVKASFSMRRKTILNSLSSYSFFQNKKHLQKILAELKIDSTRRAETLSLNEFASIANFISGPL